MEFKLEQTLEQVKSHPLFLRLQDVIENIDGFHNHETVFDHSVKTADIALREREGDFITHETAKKLFKEFLEEDVYGIKRGDVIVLTALMHDCGKLLTFKENGKDFPLNTRKPNTADQTTAPGHDFWGGHIVVPEILSSLKVNSNVIREVSRMVEMHSILNDRNYYEVRKDWPIEDLSSNVKAYAEGRFLEGLFNAYCDCFTAEPFALSKEKIIQLFNTPSLYNKREYLIS